MSKYIPAEKLIDEIERLKGLLIRGACAAQVAMETNCKDEAYNEILSCITSLQKEQPEQDITEFEKALDEFGEAYATLVDRDNNPNQGIRINAYHELVQENVNDILSLAKEYIKQEQPEVDLEKEYNEQWGGYTHDGLSATVDRVEFEQLARHFYELGLNSRKK